MSDAVVPTDRDGERKPMTGFRPKRPAPTVALYNPVWTCPACRKTHYTGAHERHCWSCGEMRPQAA